MLVQQYSVLRGYKWKHKISVCLDSKGAFAAAWHGWSVSLAINDVILMLTISL